MSQTEAPVSFLKRQEFDQKTAEIRRMQEEEFNKRVESNKQYAKLTTEKILKELRKGLEEEQKKLSDSEELFVKPESNFLVAIQIRSQINIPPCPRKTLSLLRLKHINNCVILKNNESIAKMLQNAKDYIAFGTVSYKLLRELVYSRGYGKNKANKPIKLTNENIEKHFEGKFKCIEELCDVIYHGKEGMKEVLRFLGPFKLSPPRGGFPNGHKKRSFVQGGSSNDHKELLGDLLERMI